MDCPLVRKRISPDGLVRHVFALLERGCILGGLATRARRQQYVHRLVVPFVSKPKASAQAAGRVVCPPLSCIFHAVFFRPVGGPEGVVCLHLCLLQSCIFRFISCWELQFAVAAIARFFFLRSER